MTEKSELTKLKQIIDIMNKYDLIDTFDSEEELNTWISNLNPLQEKNILRLNIDPNLIKFNTNLLINEDLLNTVDYIKRVTQIISIENADGWYHLFDELVVPEFLNSERFYSDIEKLKKAYCAQTPLWIIGNSNFINSPYHDEVFDLLVNYKDPECEDYNYFVMQAIADTARNMDSIKSGYHIQDINKYIKYGCKSVSLVHAYPRRGINMLATNKVSLCDKYHEENMDILANNQEIGSYLYAVMTDKEFVKNPQYRRLIAKMVEMKDNEPYVFSLCVYALGLTKCKNICPIDKYYYYQLLCSDKRDELMKKIEEDLKYIDGVYQDVTQPEIETKSVESPKFLSKIKNLFNNI